VIAVLFLSLRPPFSLLDSEIVHGGVATGTFVNRNHLANWLNMALAAGVGLMMGHLAVHAGRRSWRIRLRDWMELLLGGKARLRLVLVMLVIVLIATRSRMGNAAFLFALLAAASVYAVFAREHRRGLTLFVASVLAIDLLLIGAWVGVDRVVERIQQTPIFEQAGGQGAAGSGSGGLQGAAGTGPGAGQAAPGANAAAGGPAGTGASTGDAAGDRAAAHRDPRAQQSVQDRIEPALDAVAIVRDHPWLGTGGGAFYLVYMAYQPNWEGFYNHAHNDYLEIASDTGLIGLALLVGLAAHALWVAVAVLRTRHHPALRAAAFASLMAIVAMALHATVDFSLHIPANALLFTVMTALPFAARGLAARVDGAARGVGGVVAGAAASAGAAGAAGTAGASGTSGADDDDPRDPRGARRGLQGRPRRWAAGGFAAVAVAGLAVGAWATLREGLAEVLAIQANQRLQQWEGGGRMSPGQSLEAEATIRRAMALSPINPAHQESLGSIYFSRAVEPNRTGAGRLRDFDRAVVHYREATRLVPVSGYAWANLLIAKHFAGQVDLEFMVALRNAVRLAPFEPPVHSIVLGAVLPRWTQLPAEARAIAADTVMRGWPHAREVLVAEARTAPGHAAWCDRDPGVRTAEQAAWMQRLCAAVSSPGPGPRPQP
jgi:O-antigen ligase